MVCENDMESAVQTTEGVLFRIIHFINEVEPSRSHTGSSERYRLAYAFLKLSLNGVEQRFVLGEIVYMRSVRYIVSRLYLPLLDK